MSTAAPAPSWSIVVSTYPTSFAAGMTGAEGSPPGYLLLVTNSGGAPTSGEFTIAASLPIRLGFATAVGASGGYGAQQTPLTCSVAGKTVSCTGGEPSLQPGETARVLIPVNVASGTSNTLVSTATVSGGGAVPVSTRAATPVGGEPLSFDFLPGSSGFAGAISQADGSDAAVAGSHPYQFRADINFPTGLYPEGLLAIGGGVRDLGIALPPGFVVDPSAVPERCSGIELSAEACPAGAQVGTVALVASVSNGAPSVETTGLYAMTPPPGAAVEFGLNGSGGVSLHLLGRLRNDGSYGLSAEIDDILARAPILGAEVTLWGDPSDESHDHVRGACLDRGGACPIERTDEALLTLPGSCGTPLTTTASADSWLEPGVFATRSFESPAVEGCNALAFDPALIARPTTAVADSPTGFDIGVHLPQTKNYEGRAEAEIRDARLVLPEGVAINPAGAVGLGACSESQVPANCPDNAKIGKAEIDTPIVDRPLTGGVYLAKPGENPFGAMFAVYVAIDDPTTGIAIGFPARLEADAQTGRLALGLEALPQLPIEDVRLNLFQGPRALLKTPIGCGAHTTTSDLTPWSSPEGANATPADTFRTSIGADGGACPAGEADAPAALSYSAGVTTPQAGAYSDLTLRVSRKDGSQRLLAMETTLPAGVSAKLAGVSSCSDAEVTADRCRDSSKVGTVSLAAGAGGSPLRLAGSVYRAGPYEGAPLSLAIVVPARAGPFDLGTVAVRVALFVDPRSAQVRAVSDPLPTILDGIPLDLRELRVDLDRPDFAHNPTSCQAATVDGSATTAAAQIVGLQNRFQVGGCAGLGFRPRLGLRLAGPPHRGAHPSLRAVLRPRPSDSNLRRATLEVPPAELLDSRHIRSICPQDDYAAGTCPPSSVYGKAEVWSPLLNRPLSGPIFLRSSSRRLPDLAASLDGEVHIDLIGHLQSRHARIRVAFNSLPDVPLSRVVLRLAGGRRGLLVNTGSLCQDNRRARVSLSAQSGKVKALHPRLKARCG
ncbi:MAG TPA: hypothetical protein VFK14_11805 [Solirubrobacterales bacterium]|nr:hypothetical protein [Solirubrobacterales bacterium]